MRVEILPSAWEGLARIKCRVQADFGEDVALLVKHCKGKLVKAAGGIADLKDAEDFLKLGADRLGTSRIVKAVKAME